MDVWESSVRNFMDESDEPYTVQVFLHKVFHDLLRMKIKEKVKFRKREGKEFQLWIESMEDDYSTEFMDEILSDDEFWFLTLKLTRAA
jgi:hypothetical protein